MHILAFSAHSPAGLSGPARADERARAAPSTLAPSSSRGLLALLLYLNFITAD